MFLVRADEEGPAALVAEQGDRGIDLVLEIAEADDAPIGLHRVEDAVGAREGLDESVRSQVLVDPQRVEGFRVEASDGPFPQRVAGLAFGLLVEVLVDDEEDLVDLEQSSGEFRSLE